VVFICTPNEVHKSIALAALAASKNVITEKPAMLSVDEIQEVMAAEAASGKLFFVHQNRRWDEDYLVMKELYDARSMGDVTHIESRIDGSRGIPGDWRRDPSRGGGMVLDWGVHLVDRLLLMVPAPVKTVYSRLSYSMGALVEDGFMIYLTFAGGVEVLPLPRLDTDVNDFYRKRDRGHRRDGDQVGDERVGRALHARARGGQDVPRDQHGHRPV